MTCKLNLSKPQNGNLSISFWSKKKSGHCALGPKKWKCWLNFSHAWIFWYWCILKRNQKLRTIWGNVKVKRTILDNIHFISMVIGYLGLNSLEVHTSWNKVTRYWFKLSAVDRENKYRNARRHIRISRWTWSLEQSCWLWHGSSYQVNRHLI